MIYVCDPFGNDGISWSASAMDKITGLWLNLVSPGKLKLGVSKFYNVSCLLEMKCHIQTPHDSSVKLNMGQ